MNWLNQLLLLSAEPPEVIDQVVHVVFSSVVSMYVNLLRALIS